jgi:uncharacterized protein (TIGR04255 family)
MSLSADEIDFDAPPLVEVAYSIQFEAIPNFHIAMFGVIWETFRECYPIVEYAQNIQHIVEKFGVVSDRPQPGLQLVNSPFNTERAMFYSEDKQFLIQIQDDRFVFNWRKYGIQDCVYPRYEVIKKRFLDELLSFQQVLEKNNFEPLVFDQMEMTYINHIDLDLSSANEVFKNIFDNSSFTEDAEIERINLDIKQLLKYEGRRIGRTHTSIQQGNRLSDKSELFVLKFITRAHPVGDGIEGVLPVIELMRNTINNRFKSITSEKMHSVWEKR